MGPVQSKLGISKGLVLLAKIARCKEYWRTGSAQNNKQAAAQRTDPTKPNQTELNPTELGG